MVVIGYSCWGSGSPIPEILTLGYIDIFMAEKTHKVRKTALVGGWTNPFEKYARQIGSFPQIGVKIKNIWNHHLVFTFSFSFSSHLGATICNFFPSFYVG